MGKIIVTPEASSPSPILGKIQIYYKSDNLLYYMPPDGIEVGPIRPADMQGVFRNGRQVIYYDEFLTPNAVYMTGAAISGGTVTQRNGGGSEIGVVAINKSTTANGGYRYATQSSTTAGLSHVLQNGHVFKAKILQEYNVNVTLRLGFHNAINITAPTDGVYFEILNGIAKGVCVASGGSSTTTGDYALTLNTWYIIKAEIQSGSAIFKIFDSSEVELFSESVASNIPTNSVGWGAVGTESSATARNGILLLDYIRVDL